MDSSKQGPLTLAELQAIWLGAVDGTYSGPYIAAGDGNGLEVHSQAFAQQARASLAVDVSFQSMFLLPWSGQTNPPASGPNQATVAITFQRTGRMGDPLVLGAGLVWVDEQALDWSPTGPMPVDTGRRYLLGADVVFFPGEQGPFTAEATAEKSGYGYNNPAPGTINLVEQPGAGRYNSLATVTVTDAPVPPAAPMPQQSVALVGDDLPDMFTPDQIGQYAGFTGGANQGLSGRILQFVAPTATAGSGVLLEQLLCVALTAPPADAFVVGGAVDVLSGTTVLNGGVVVAARIGPGGLYCVAIRITSGAAGQCVPGDTVSQPLGAVGTAQGTVQSVLSSGAYAAEAPSGAPETGGASWQVLPWAAWGLTCSNALSPSGGTLGMLDLLGGEKNLPRLPGEDDGDYRLRQSRIADVVTPNAIRRALVRDVGATGWCLREAGGPLLPGMFYDRTDEGGDEYDDGAVLMSGSYTTGQFLAGEECWYVRGGLPLLRGHWGVVMTPVTSANPTGYWPPSVTTAVPTSSPGAQFTLVLRDHRFDPVFPTPVHEAGDYVVGRRSGAVFTPSAVLANPVPDQRRWSCYLDLLESEAFFVAQVPIEGIADFGFAYDAGSENAYDGGAQWFNFYDGFPTGDGAYYQRVYGDIDRIRAGGVGWELEQSDGAACS